MNENTATFAPSGKNCARLTPGQRFSVNLIPRLSFRHRLTLNIHILVITLSFVLVLQNAITYSSHTNTEMKRAVFSRWSFFFVVFFFQCTLQSRTREGVNSVLKLFTISIYTDFRHVHRSIRKEEGEKKEKKKMPTLTPKSVKSVSDEENLHRGIQETCTGDSVCIGHSRILIFQSDRRLWVNVGRSLLLHFIKRHHYLFIDFYIFFLVSFFTYRFKI